MASETFLSITKPVLSRVLIDIRVKTFVLHCPLHVN